MQQNGSAKLIVIIVLIAVVIGGGFFFYRMRKSVVPADTKVEETDGLSAVGTAEVEAELNAIDLEGMDAELGDIEKELAQ